MLLLQNGLIYRNREFKRGSVLVSGGSIAHIFYGESQPEILDILTKKYAGESVISIDLNQKYLLPGLADVHVHLREPGFSYKETIATGTRAAARGGFTVVCAMPNLNPPPDSLGNLRLQLDAIAADAAVSVIPYGTITRGRQGSVLAEIEEIAPFTAGYSDDGNGIQSEGLMLAAMERIAPTGKILAAHCEDESLLRGGYIHDGEYARRNSHAGICSESEWRQLGRDLDLVRRTGCAYHACHISTAESVSLIRRAKAEGLPVSCETAPHYLYFCDGGLREDGRFKMNPPLRGESDRSALLEGIADGTIDIIATDHAPHTAEEKSRGLASSAMGVTGLECAFAAAYTALCKGILSGGKSVGRVITPGRLTEIMSVNPRKRFGLSGGKIAVGEAADLTIIDTSACSRIDPAAFVSMGKSTPFDGETLSGEVAMTVYRGEIVYKSDEIKIPN